MNMNINDLLLQNPNCGINYDNYSINHQSTTFNSNETKNDVTYPLKESKNTNENTIEDQITNFIENFFQKNNNMNDINILSEGINCNLIETKNQFEEKIYNNNVPEQVKPEEDQKVLNSLLGQLSELEKIFIHNKNRNY